MTSEGRIRTYCIFTACESRRGRRDIGIPGFVRFFSAWDTGVPKNQSVFCLSVQDGQEGWKTMILRIRYENEVRSIELDAEATEGLWVSLELETDEEITQPEREKRIQDAFDEKFNRPEYNNYHKFTRHQGFSKAQPGKDETEDDVDTSEPLMKEVFDDRIFRRDEIARAEKEEYEAACQWIREILVKKPKWAEAFIAVRLDGMAVNDYAASIGLSDASVISKWLARAAKKLKENWDKRQI